MGVIPGELDGLLAARYAAGGHPSIPPDRIPRASLQQVVYSVRSVQLLMEQGTQVDSTQPTAVWL